MLSLGMTLALLILLLLRMPISMAIALASLPPLLLLHRNLVVIPQFMLSGVHSVPLLALPFFILAGNLFSALGLSRRIWNFAGSVVGHLRGGLGQVMVIAVAIFSGISGSALADAGALGAIGIPEMERHGYRRPFAAAITLCSSAIGPMVPPSINLIIYGIIAQVSIGRLFLAGILPGLIVAIAMMATIYLIALAGREPCPTFKRARPREVAGHFVVSLPALAVPVIVVLGMGFGLLTPTEVGVFASAYALVLGLFYREASLKDLWRAAAESTFATVNIMFIIAVSTVAGWVYTYDGTAQALASWLFSFTDSHTLSLLIINVFLLVLGFFLEPIPLMILTLPIVLPLLHSLQIDPVQFGIIMSLNITIGIVHPPVGIGLYIMTRIANVRYEELVLATLPLLVPLLACLLLFTFIPPLSLWLPAMVMGP